MQKLYAVLPIVLFLCTCFNLKGQEFVKPGLEFTCELKVTISELLHLGTTPHGERIIIPITGGTFERPNMKGIVLNEGADYQYANKALGRTELDAIYTIKTDDNVLIHIRNLGILSKAYDENEEPNYGVYFRTTPQFEAPIDSKYNWL
ncbi:DUF3237 domain-containing protein [Carboxylicivirga sp. A043]|uniref:DUF3237 domain-containing protein n=1 Tax=Carboxylicivirga litoralis TaxID=2816963 RepID=UPI0021CAEF85|nr:DUF3237 domain-containing protein [Carboxylicivirga sp. A043]MCU4158323.1 DUF3237 domain-containing protein [Carboxylicivirga sp. A043]